MRCPNCTYIIGGGAGLGGCFCDIEEEPSTDWEPPGDKENFWLFCSRAKREGWLGRNEWCAIYYDKDRGTPSFGNWNGTATDTEEMAKQMVGDLRGHRNWGEYEHVGAHRMADLVQWYEREKARRGG